MAMKLLLVFGINIQRNSSVSMANIAYIRGFILNSCEVTVIMPDCLESEKDQSIILPSKASYIFVQSEKKWIDGVKRIKPNQLNQDISKKNKFEIVRYKIYRLLARIKNKLINQKSIYGVHEEYIRNISKIKINEKYDYIISMSSPPAAHEAAYRLINSSKIQYEKWCQLWQDPWYYDLYLNKNKEILTKEKELLACADKIIYVSPLTCNYQKQYVKEFAEKMSWEYLPCYKESSQKNDINVDHNDITIGYFGEYYLKTRNIIPLHKAILNQNVKFIVCGNSDYIIESTDKIKSLARVSYNRVEKLQEECDVLVSLSNLTGGQIPGKLYQYAGTNKYVLFILDGTPEEVQELYKIFSKYSRFVFCENDTESIEKAILKIKNNSVKTENYPVYDFNPYVIVSKILDKLKA
jgi:glycosyltransferase involved in cell wall biosynthesis